MSVLTRKEIEERLKKPLGCPKSIVLTPLLDDNFDEDAVDLRLGCYFRSPAVSSIACIRPYQDTKDCYPELIHKPYRKTKRNSGQESNNDIYLTATSCSIGEYA